MLVLTRKIDQAVVVGGATELEHLLKITVLEIGNGKVRLGFEVDASVPVHRWEVWERIRVESRSDGLPEVLEELIAECAVVHVGRPPDAPPEVLEALIVR